MTFKTNLEVLKPIGISINGYIEGFSWKIIWMNAFTTSSDPKIVGGYYMDPVERLGGFPRIVRGDRAQRTLNKDFQRFLCRNIHVSSAIDSYIESYCHVFVKPTSKFNCHKLLSIWANFLQLADCMAVFILIWIRAQ